MNCTNDFFLYESVKAFGFSHFVLGLLVGVFVFVCIPLAIERFGNKDKGDNKF